MNSQTVVDFGLRVERWIISFGWKSDIGNEPERNWECSESDFYRRICSFATNRIFAISKFCYFPFPCSILSISKCILNNASISHLFWFHPYNFCSKWQYLDFNKSLAIRPGFGDFRQNLEHSSQSLGNSIKLTHLFHLGRFLFRLRCYQCLLEKWWSFIMTGFDMNQFGWFKINAKRLFCHTQVWSSASRKAWRMRL